MIIHPTKTESMLFGTYQRLAHASSLDIKIGSQSLKQVFTYKYLGVHLDASLSFEHHINKLTKKVSKRLGALGRVRPHLTTAPANTIYKAFVLSTLDYCDICWNSMGSTLSEKIERLQKRAAKIVLRDKSSEDPVRQLGWEKLQLRQKQHLCLFIFKCLNRLVAC